MNIVNKTPLQVRVFDLQGVKEGEIGVIITAIDSYIKHHPHSLNLETMLWVRNELYEAL